MSSLATLPASSVLAFLHDTRIFCTASAFLFRFTLTIVAILSIGIPLSFGTLLSLSYSGEHNFITCVLQLLLVLCLKYNKMAVNRSIHCVFRYASSPYILGSAPFTNVSEHFFNHSFRIFSVRFQCQLTFLWFNNTCLINVLFELWFLSITGDIQKILQCSKMFKQSQIWHLKKSSDNKFSFHAVAIKNKKHIGKRKYVID